MTLGVVLALTGRAKGAEEAFSRVIAANGQPVAPHPEQPNSRTTLGGALNDLRTALAAKGDINSAIVRYHQAIDHRRAVFDRQLQVTQFRRFLSNHHYGLARALRALGRTGEAT